MSRLKRRVWDIPGGVHPPENKIQSLQTEIEAAGIPPQLVLPLSQHVGTPAKATISVGERVLKGQKIADADGPVSVPVHATSSGTVVAVEERPISHPSGMTAPCIVIETDGLDEAAPAQDLQNWRDCEPAQLIAAIREAGITGLGGAGFPTAIKLDPGNRHIDTLVINGTECEPYITADDILMRERAREIVEGIAILQHILQPQEILIGIEDNKPQALAAMIAASEKLPMTVVDFPTKYPSGGEKQLIQILTGKEVPVGGLPADIGIVCQNVGTAVAVKQAICDGQALISRITTLTGRALGRQQNLEVRLGTPVGFLLEHCAYREQQSSRVVIGGPMMGYAIDNLDIPVVKTTNCILAPDAQEMPPQPPAQACIRCGMCAEACPASLLPQQLYWYARAKEHSKLEEHHLFDCIECGACSYVCPSNIPLVQYYRASKADIRMARVENEKSEHAKQRFEFREARLQRLEAEKEAKRAARKAAAEARAKQAAADSDAAVDPVQAAIDRVKAKRGDSNLDSKIERVKDKHAGLSAEADHRAALEKIQTKLAAAKEKHAEAVVNQLDTADAFARSVETLQKKLAEAENALTEVQQSTSAAPVAAGSDDPVQAAIERAKAKRAGMAVEENPQANIDKLQQRLDKAREKLAAATAADDGNIEAFRAAVEKLEQKLADAQSNKKTAEPEAVDSVDPVQAAIDRAKAKRANQQNSDPAAGRIGKLEQRLDKARQKLESARANGDPNLEAFTTAVEKLEQKLAEAQAETEGSR